MRTGRRKSKSIAPPPEFIIPAGLRLTAKNESRYAWHLTLEDLGVLVRCPHCKTVPSSKLFTSLGQRVTHARDLPIDRKATHLAVSRSRFKCLTCHRVFCLPVKELDDGRRGITYRLIDYLKRHVLENTSAELLARTHVSVPTLSRISIEQITDLEAKHTIKVPKVLGVFSCDTPRCQFGLITDAEAGTLVDVLSDAETATLEQWFHRVGSASSTIEIVQIDPYESHRSVVFNRLPAVTLITSWNCVDKIAKDLLMHAANRLGSRGWTVRKKLERDGVLLKCDPGSLGINERKKAEFLLTRDTTLCLYYDLTHKLDKIRKASNRAEARAFYREWRNLIPAEHVAYFEPVLSTLSEWEDELFGYLSLSPQLPEHAEGIRDVIREVNRNASGFSFPQLRGRMLFSKTIQQRISKLTHQQAEQSARQTRA